MKSDPNPPTTMAAATPNKNCKAGECRDLPAGINREEVISDYVVISKLFAVVLRNDNSLL
jgi:hypothetical protein